MIGQKVPRTHVLTERRRAPKPSEEAKDQHLRLCPREAADEVEDEEEEVGQLQDGHTAVHFG